MSLKAQIYTHPSERGRLQRQKLWRWSRKTYFVALHAGLGKLFLVAGSAEDLVILGEEAGSANHLLALAADETVLVPDGLLVLHILIPFRMKRQEGSVLLLGALRAIGCLRRARLCQATGPSRPASWSWTRPPCVPRPAAAENSYLPRWASGSPCRRGPLR